MHNLQILAFYNEPLFDWQPKLQRFNALSGNFRKNLKKLAFVHLLKFLKNLSFDDRKVLLIQYKFNQRSLFIKRISLY